jgi:hypothetical protein
MQVYAACKTDATQCCLFTCRCKMPPLVTRGASFDIVVAVGGLVTTAVGMVWTYEQPSISVISPTTLTPQGRAAGVMGSLGPTSATWITIAGVNFGALQGTVSITPRILTCTNWTHHSIVCEAPPGVLSINVVRVITAAGQASVPAVAAQLSYTPPVVEAVGWVNGSADYTPLITGTPGERLLAIAGSSFAVPPLAVSVWLVRGGAAVDLAPPWVDLPPMASESAPGGSARLRCPVAAASANSTSVFCTVPPGSGVGWRVIVVNHDAPVDEPVVEPGADGRLSTLRWRSSAPSTASFSYHAPTLTAVSIKTGARIVGAPAAGGFVVHVIGTNFSPWAPVVTVGSLPCVVVPGSNNHTSLLCIAPPRQVDAGDDVTVTVDGQVTAATQLAYDPPLIIEVTPSIVDASETPGSPRPSIVLRGINFGLRYREGVSLNHSVAIGGRPCDAIMWMSDVQLVCTLRPDISFAVGTYNVTVVVARVSAVPFPVAASCPVGMHGLRGFPCQACPTGATCQGRESDPVAKPGYYPLQRAEFVTCVPPDACMGGVTAGDVSGGDAASQGCKRNYAGMRCALCSSTAYRFKGACRACPNTAWVLFLLFGVAILAAVLAGIYLSKKRINLAGMSVGVVRVSL